MKVATAAEMREFDRTTIEVVGIPSLVLMENAGAAVAARAEEICDGRKVLVLCGGGNNGGDGLVAARKLLNRGFDVRAVVFAGSDSMSQDCKTQYRISGKMGLRIELKKSLMAADLHSALVIDAVFGTGLSRAVGGQLAETFRAVNESG
ncbi:MAG TPA: NAD(P)H-hydrate epimerase, partial [Dissulfurispiraceae bacterium]|nr:NAD(P)H-hydrate epimerase [Dissulfurispiraceae bacterium]